MHLLRLLIVLATVSLARADLCPTCADRTFPSDAGKCGACGAESISTGVKLCQRCSQKLKQCEACQAAVKITPAPGPQGIEGKVIKLTGNFMPTVVEKEGDKPPGRGTTTALAVPVHVFKGKIKIFEQPDPKHPALVKIIQADKNGHYQLTLPPGEYTVVAEINHKLYLNSMDGQGHWSTTTVKPNQWTHWSIQDSSDAAF